MKRLAIFAVFAVGLASVASALTLEPGGAFPGTTTTSAFNAIGTFNFGNQKARLTTPGQADVLGGNPGNGWWGANDGSGGVKRSWEVVWDNTTGIVTFYGTSPTSSDALTWTGEFDVPARFDTDAFSASYEELNASSVSLPIAEIRL